MTIGFAGSRKPRICVSMIQKSFNFFSESNLFICQKLEFKKKKKNLPIIVSDREVSAVLIVDVGALFVC